MDFDVDFTIDCGILPKFSIDEESDDVWDRAYHRGQALYRSVVEAPRWKVVAGVTAVTAVVAGAVFGGHYIYSHWGIFFPPEVVEEGWEERVLSPGRGAARYDMYTAYTTDSEARLRMSHKVVAQHRTYANRHGYRYHAFEGNPKLPCQNVYGEAEPCQPHWSKVMLADQLLAGVYSDEDAKAPEWYVWLDDDVVPTNMQKSFDEVTSRYGADPKVKIIVTKDADSGWNEKNPLNTGVIFFRNVPGTQSLGSGTK